MSKNILVYADGTGNEGGLLPDESRSNVYKMFRATRSGPDSTVDPSTQIAFYIPGIGTPIPGRHLTIREIAQQAVGAGLTRKVIDCYAAILSVWRPGDRIYLFGFSRGAYTVRCVAHVLEVAGIPTTQPGAQSLSLDPDSLRKVAWSAVRLLYRCGFTLKDSDKRRKRVASFQQQHYPQLGPEVGATPYFIGVWDTVAAIGWAHLFPWPYDLHVPTQARFVRHALAIDEYRKDFNRVKWGGANLRQPEPGEPYPFEQIWFAGNHADVGGSHPENESRLSDITLRWMTDFVTKELPVECRVFVDESVLDLHPSSDGMMHDECMVGIGGTPLHWYPADREVPAEAVLHETVYERLKMESVRNYTTYGKYRPAPLRNHAKAKQYFEQIPSPLEH